LRLPGRLPSRAAIRALLAATVLARLVDPALALARDLWRQLHQDRALISHYAAAATHYPKISECSTGHVMRGARKYNTRAGQ
jgi:hypothetical protein